MTKPPAPQYAIAASDRVAGVRVGAKVVYSLVRTNVVTSPSGASPGIAESEDAILDEYTLGHPYTDERVVRPKVRWTIVPEPSFELTRAGEFDGSPGTFAADAYVVAVEWNRPGAHRVRCVIEPAPPWGARRLVVDSRQLVLTAEEDAAKFDQHWAVTRSLSVLGGDAETATTSPERVAIEIVHTIEVADAIERRHPTIDFEAKKAYLRDRERQSRYASALYERLLSVNANDHQRHAVTALHAGPVDNVALQLFVAVGHEPRLEGLASQGRARVQIVDWTDASDRTYSGTYSGTGDHVADALARALLAWRQQSRYPDGSMRFELPPPVAEILGVAAARGRLDPERLRDLRDEVGLDVSAHVSGLALEGKFTTEGPVDVAEVLDGVAFASAMTATALMLAAPLPGSRAVAALLWTSAVTGAGASTVRIATRHAAGVSDPTAAAIDALGIVSSLLIIPGANAVWRQGAKIAVREALVLGRGTGVLKMALVGQVVADGLQGMLIGHEAYAVIQKVLEDGSKDPNARLAQVAKMSAQLVAVGTLVAVGAKANLDDLAALGRSDAGLRRLADPDAEIDLVDGAGSAGDTRARKHVDIADIDVPADGRLRPARSELTPAARAVLGELDAAATAKVRRMLDADGVGASFLIERFGRSALDVADDFVAVWKRWTELDLPPAWLRTVHEHTLLHGVRYFAKLPRGAVGDAEMAAGGWACMREEHFHALYENAGHSIKRHGPHLPDGPGEVLEARVKTGYAPDVELHTRELPGGGTEQVWDFVAAPTARSSRFLSFQDWLDAHESAYAALNHDFPGAGLDMRTGPIRGTGRNADKSYPIAAGYLSFRDVDDPTKVIVRPIGESYEGVKDGSEYMVNFRRANGVEYQGPIYPHARRIPRAEVTHVYATLGWTGDEWILINLYPAKPPENPAAILLQKRQNRGRDKI